MRQLVRRRKPSARLSAGVVALALLACERPPASPDPAPGQPFSGERARERLGQLLRLPRALGDPRRRAAIDELAALLRSAGADTLERLEHSGEDPWTHTRFAMRFVPLRICRLDTGGG